MWRSRRCCRRWRGGSAQPPGEFRRKGSSQHGSGSASCGAGGSLVPAAITPSAMAHVVGSADLPGRMAHHDHESNRRWRRSRRRAAPCHDAHARRRCRGIRTPGRDAHTSARPGAMDHTPSRRKFAGERRHRIRRSPDRTRGARTAHAGGGRGVLRRAGDTRAGERDRRWRHPPAGARGARRTDRDGVRRAARRLAGGTRGTARSTANP
jgi:hypothetical protein